MGERATFTRMEDSTADDWRRIGAEFPAFASQLPDRLLAHLFHDVGDTLGCYNHFDIAAAVLKPFVSEPNLWMVQHHGIFQGYYFFHHIGLDREMRERFRGHPHFERTAEFCALYDNPAFDPKAETLPLAAFDPLVRRVCAQPKNSIYQAATSVTAPDGAARAAA